MSTSRSEGAAGSEAMECAHCGLPAGRSRAAAGGMQWFCCAGCRTAYDLIHRIGLQDYYRFAANQESRAGPVGDVVIRYDDFDDPSFFAKHVRSLERGLQQCTFAVEGLRCAACVWLLEKLPSFVEGVINARVDWAHSSVVVQWRAGESGLSAIATAIAELGYRPHVLGLEHASRAIPPQDRRLVIQIGIAAAAAGNNMVLAIALYFGMFSFMGEGITELFRMASCAVGLVSVFGPGKVFLDGARVALRTKTPHMDLPVALGLLVGSIAGLINTLRGDGEIYFDTLSVLVLLLLAGRWLQADQQRRAAASAETLSHLTPPVAHKWVDGRFVDVPAEVLMSADHIEVRPQETFPADGRLQSGMARVDAAILTGESSPVVIESNQEIYAGSINLGPSVRIEVTAVGPSTRIGKIAALVHDAGAKRPAVVQWANRIGARFVVMVLVVGAATFAFWWGRDASAAVEHTVALLVVACPCALGLATPMAIAVAVGKAARRRILVKEGDVFQRLSRSGTIWLDKTGTLTVGRIEVLQWHGSTGIQPQVLTLEQGASHPVARGLVSYLNRRGVVHGRGEVRIRTDAGGIIGQFEDACVAVGSLELMRAHGISVPEWIKGSVGLTLAAGLAPVFVARNGEVVAWASLGDPLRPGARRAVQRLQRRGWVVGILSGDHPEVVRRVGETLGLSPERCHGGLTPEAKMARVMEGGEHVVMVGDGVNDSVALAAAAVGIAAHGSAEASLRAAPVYLADPGIDSVLDLVDGSRGVLATIRRNLALSLSYNVLAVAMAATGFINPLVAAILMPASSLSVMASSLATRWKGRP